MADKWKIGNRFNEDVIKNHSFIWNRFKYDENVNKYEYYILHTNWLSRN